MSPRSRSFVGGGSIDFETIWVIDTPNEVAVDIISLSNYLENTAIPLGMAAGTIENDIRERFDTETDPGGMQWVDLSERWADRKKSDPRFLPYGDSPSGDYILRLTGDLYESAIDPGNFQVHGNTLVYSPDQLPDYAGVHQHGDGRVPARPWAGISEEAAEEIFMEAAAWVDIGVQEYWDQGKGNFSDFGDLGITKPPVQMSHVSVFTHKSGRQQFRIGGRFGPNV